MQWRQRELGNRLRDMTMGWELDKLLIRFSRRAEKIMEGEELETLGGNLGGYLARTNCNLQATVNPSRDIIIYLTIAALLVSISPSSMTF